MQFFSDYIDFRFKAKHEELNNFYIFLTVPQPLLRNFFSINSYSLLGESLFSYK